MSGIKIRPESGNEEGGFWLLFIGGYFSLSLALIFLDWIGVAVPVPDNKLLLIAEILALAAVSLCVVMAACILIGKAVNAALLAVTQVVSFIVSQVEAASTRLFERGLPLLLGLLTLPFLPLRIAAACLFNSYIAPALERRRQRAELRRLFEEVRGDYASFDEFVRHFNGGEPAGNEGDNSRSEDRAAAAPADQFAIACRTFGLPEDGSFSAAHFKARYLEIMKAIHPDVIGPNLFATQLNEARALIKSRKGWK